MHSPAVPYAFLDRPAILPRGNVTSHVTDVLRRAIVSLEFQPGAPIDRNAVCAQLNVSRFPVAEALARLAAEGLVDIQPQRGTSVSRIRVPEVAEYMFVRKALEAEAVRTLAAAGGGAVAVDLRRELAAQRQAAARNDRDAFYAHDLAFHEHLVTSLNFTRVKSIIDSARANVDRARRLIRSPRRMAVTIAEHEAILAGIEAGDAERAASAMRVHIEAVMDELAAFAHIHPENFADGGD